MAPVITYSPAVGVVASPARLTRRARLLASVLVVLGLLTSMLTTPTRADATTLPPRTAVERHIAWVIQALINKERAQHGIHPVWMNSHLQLSARRHNVTMARFNTMSHQLPGEAFFARRMTQAGYRWNYAGENIGWNGDMSLSGVVVLEKLMYGERAPENGHRLNILNRHYRNVGVDVYLDREHHKIWLTTDFGHHASA
jgi:uncharacterized protein YkwD